MFGPSKLERRIEELEKEVREMRWELMKVRSYCSRRIGDWVGYPDGRPSISAMDIADKLLQNAGIEIREQTAGFEFIQRKGGGA